MTSYQEAVEMILECIGATEVVEQSLVTCLNQVAAEDVFSPFDLPRTDTAGPDGYAVKSSDIVTAGRDNPVALEIIGAVQAGGLPNKEVRHGTAVRIMTGSVMPKGADCVVNFENTDEPGDKSGPNPANPKQVRIHVAAAQGFGVRVAGSDSSKGELIVAKGTAIGPGQIAALAAHGMSCVKVYRRPVVAIISTGNELIPPGRPLPPAKTYDSNTAALATLIRHYGGTPKVIGIARDTLRSVEGKIRKAMTADAVITSGGASRGDYDLIRLALGRIGTQVFSRINMGPGASVAFGLIDTPGGDGVNGSIPLFALAGPPSGCLVNFETLVRPALLKMLGYVDVRHPEIEAEALDDSPSARRMAFARWSRLQKTDGRYQVRLDGAMGSFPSIAASNALTIIPEGFSFKAGETIPVLPLDWKIG